MFKILMLFFICGNAYATYNPKLETDTYFLSKKYERVNIEKYAEKWADHFSIPRAIVKSVIEQESHWKHDAISSVNAKGLMQVMEGTASDMKKKSSESLFNPYTNIYYGCKYLRYLLNRYEENMRVALASYYAGPKWGDRLVNGELREGRFKKEILGYASSVMSKVFNYMGANHAKEEGSNKGSKSIRGTVHSPS